MENNVDELTKDIDEKIKEFEIGKSPYTTKYRIKVSNIRYGQALEL